MCLSELYRCLFRCKQENCLRCSSPHSSLRLKGCIFFQYVQFSKDTLEEVSQFLPTQPPSDVNGSRAHRSLGKFWLIMWGFCFFFSFLKNNCKNDFSQLKLHNLFFFVPWLSSRHNVENKARSPFYTSRTGLSYVKYRVFEILKHYLSSTPFAIASF